jgi:hypothetical protein
MGSVELATPRSNRLFMPEIVPSSADRIASN